MRVLERRVASDEVEAESLIKEAKRLRRRRWLIRTSGVLTAVLLGGGGIYLATDHSGRVPSTPAIASSAPLPFVNFKAFGSKGELAFVSRGTLWVLDGPQRRLREVLLPSGLVPQSPAISPDGKWLAFVTGSTSFGDASLWLATSAGTGVHRIAGLVVGDAFGWSPRADLYAVAAGPLSTRPPDAQPTTVRLISPIGSSRTVMSADSIIGAAWSPDGAELAVSTMNRKFVSTLATYPIGGGRPTVWRGAPSGNDEFVVPAGWWTGQGIAFTVITNGAVPDGSGSFSGAEFYVMPRPGAPSRLLGETLTNDATGAPTASASGVLAFVNNTGDPRVVWEGEQVGVCRPGGICAVVPMPSGDVAEEPAWSPSGGTLAYVVAPSSTAAGTEGLNGGLSGWYRAHRIVLFTPTTGTVRTLANAPGATNPEWSKNNGNLLYVANDSLWMVKAGLGEPVKVAGPLFLDYTSVAYYGEVDWAQQFGWSESTHLTTCYVVCNPGQ